MPRLLRFMIRNAADSPEIVGGTIRRASSPPGNFSTLMTSAPISASSIEHAGPAMTCDRSITFRPASGPFSFCPVTVAIPLPFSVSSLQAILPFPSPPAKYQSVAYQGLAPGNAAKSVEGFAITAQENGTACAANCDFELPGEGPRHRAGHICTARFFGTITALIFGGWKSPAGGDSTVRIKTMSKVEPGTVCD